VEFSDSSAKDSEGTPEEHYVEEKRDIVTGHNHTNKFTAWMSNK